MDDDLAGFRLGLRRAESRRVAARVRRSERSGLSRRRGDEAQQGRRSEKIVAHIVLLVCRPRPVPKEPCPGPPRQSPKTGGAAKPVYIIGRTIHISQSLMGVSPSLSETLWHLSYTYMTPTPRSPPPHGKPATATAEYSRHRRPQAPPPAHHRETPRRTAHAATVQPLHTGQPAGPRP